MMEPDGARGQGDLVPHPWMTSPWTTVWECSISRPVSEVAGIAVDLDQEHRVVADELRVRLRAGLRVAVDRRR